MSASRPSPPTISTVFLVNPASGSGGTGKRWPELAHRAAQLGLEGETLFSERPGHMIELAERAARDGAGLLVAVSGDGTLNETVNGLVRAGTGAELAMIPLGTAMDFGRTHAIPARFDDAVRTAASGTVRSIDVGRVTYREWSGSENVRYFGNVASVGMSAAVAKRADEMSKRLGARLTFFYALTRVFLEWQNTSVSVQLADGTRRDGKMHDVIVANGCWHGGGMRLAPDALQDDGLFDVVVVGDINKRDFVTTAPKIYKGTYLAHPKVELLRSSSVSAEAPEHLPIELDGEQVGTTPARFEVVPAALRLRVPS